MEKYINKETVIEDNTYKILQSSVMCPLCKNIYIKPVMCKCQNVYCQRCIDNWKKEHNTCPNNCENPEYQECLFKNEFLFKLKFYCVGCDKELAYNEAESHHNSCCPNKTSGDMDINKKRKSKLVKLKPDEVAELRKKGSELTEITGMTNNIFIFIF